MRVQLILYLIPCLAMLGCGTLNNVVQGTPPAEPPHIYEPAMEIYGGVRGDWRDANDSLTPPYEPTLLENAERVTGAAILLADLPLSAIGDTVMLAKTVQETRKRREAVD